MSYHRVCLVVRVVADEEAVADVAVVRPSEAAVAAGPTAAAADSVAAAARLAFLSRMMMIRSSQARCTIPPLTRALNIRGTKPPSVHRTRPSLSGNAMRI
jgi:hypothetical protein